MNYLQNKKLKLISLFLIIMMMSIFCLAGCGEKNTEGDSGDEVVTYKAVTEPTFAPFDTTDEEGNIIGFDMDLMNAIGEDQGFKVEYVAMEFDALIPAVESGSADMITAGMNAMDPARQEHVDFSTTYYDSGLVTLVKADNNKITGIDSLTKDMKVASQIGTTGADEVTSLKDDGKIKEAVILNGFDTCVLQLKNGDVDAVIIDLPVANNYMSKDADSFKIVGDTLNAESYGFAVQKGNTELLEKINKGMQNLKDNGKFDEIYNKWIEE